MIDTTPIMTDAVRTLLAMNAEVVPPKYIAPVLKMSESVLIHRVKTGEWDEEVHGKVIVSGHRVKFFRLDFLQKHGFIQPKPQGKTPEQLLQEISDRMDILTKAVICLQDARQRELFLRLVEELEKETAGAATPTE